MEKLRKYIRKEIQSLHEQKSYPVPLELIDVMKDELEMRPLKRYVNNIKAVNSIPPSYKIFLHNGQDFDLYIEDRSIVAKIGPKSYYLMDMEENAEAIKELNRLLTQPIPSSGEEDTGDQAGDTSADAGGADTEMEPPAEEPAEEEPEA